MFCIISAYVINKYWKSTTVPAPGTASDKAVEAASSREHCGSRKIVLEVSYVSTYFRQAWGFLESQCCSEWLFLPATEDRKCPKPEMQCRAQ
ncbi:hypothetical protein EMIT0194MI4_50406 [Pseudomonas sp. IT-194MI4]